MIYLLHYFNKNKFVCCLALGLFFCPLVKSQQIVSPAKEMAMGLLKKTSSIVALNQSSSNTYQVTDAYQDRITGLFLVYTQQMYMNVPVYNKISVYSFKNDSLVYNRQDVAGIKATAGARTAGYSITPEQAIQFAAKHLSITASQQPQMLRKDDQLKRYVYKVAGLEADSTSADLIWLPMNNGKELRLAWNIHIPSPDKNDDWLIRIDAQTGAYLEKNNLVVQEHATNDCEPSSTPILQSRLVLKPTAVPGTMKIPFAPPTVTGASYNVYPIPLISPDFGPRSIETNPWQKAGNGNNAITNGWHFDGTTNYNFTRGNNVWTQADIPGNENHTGPADTSTTGPVTLSFSNPIDFSLSPVSRNNLHAGLDNLFYWNNIMHDISYQYGFDEAAGNFQASNLGRGGKENDYVNAYSADGAGTDNADFNTPPDGQNPRMRMFLWNNNRFTAEFKISSPSSIAGHYNATEFLFEQSVDASGKPEVDQHNIPILIPGYSAPNLLINTGPKASNIVLVNDDAIGSSHGACGPIFNASALNGNIALIDFGCPTTEAIKFAQNAGAIAIIFVSNQPFLFTIFAPKDLTVTIPVVLITSTDGDILKANLAGLRGTLSAAELLRDGALDNGVVAHEYTHGISNRLTGGPSNTNCLNNLSDPEEAGEGWSDFVSLMVTTNWATTTINDGANPRPVGTYVLFQPTSGSGFRAFPYSTDMNINPLTYADMATSTNGEPHAVGTIFCTALWDMTWNIIQQEGIDPDIYHGTKGNNIALQLVMMGLKLQPCSPGFIDSRDAILKADSLLYGYRHRCAIWKAFARRGMGRSSSQGLSSSFTDQVATTDLPLLDLSITANRNALVNGDNVTYTLKAECLCAAVNNVSLVDTLSPFLTYVSSSGGVYTSPIVHFDGLNFMPGDTKTFTITAKTGGQHSIPVTLINDSQDPANYGWTSTDILGDWVVSNAQSHSPSHAWFAASAGGFAIRNLVSGNLVLNSNNEFMLSFWHYYETLPNADQGFVELTTDGGVTWKDLGPYMTQNGYGVDIINNPAGFSGSSNGNFIQTIVSLAAFSGQTVKIRFRFNSFTSDVGWYVDDILLNANPGITNNVYAYNGSNLVTNSNLFRPFSNAALAVNFISFDAQKQNKSAALHWKVSNEINISKYVVERSSDGINFSSIGEVIYSNTAAIEKDYYYTDNQPLTGNNYYRIAEKDLDGKSTLSVVKLVRFDDGQLVISLQPVPTYNHTVQLRIDNAGDGSFNAQLVNAVGQLVKTYNVKSGVNQLGLQNFSKGIYYLKIQLNNGDMKVMKLSIQ